MPRGQSGDLLLAFGKSHCSQHFLKRDRLDHVLVNPFCKGLTHFVQLQNVDQSHCITILQEAKHFCSLELDIALATQIDHIAFGTCTILASGMVAAQTVSHSGPNLQSQGHQFFHHRPRLQQAWVWCKNIRVWHPFQFQGDHFRIHRILKHFQVLNQSSDSAGQFVLSFHAESVWDAFVVGQHLMKVQHPVVLLDEFPFQADTSRQRVFSCFKQLSRCDTSKPGGLQQIHQQDQRQKRMGFLQASICRNAHHPNVMCNKAGQSQQLTGCCDDFLVLLVFG